MQKITSVSELREAIIQLEQIQSAEKEVLKAQIHLAVESLRPVNILRSTLSEAMSGGLMTNIFGAAFGQTAGYVSQKLVVGRSTNPVMRLVGSALRTGITAFISTYGDTIRQTTSIIYKTLFKKKAKPEDEQKELDQDLS
jgi:hypothetical protein